MKKLARPAKTRIIKVLGLSDTYFEVPASEAARFSHGYMVLTDGTTQDIPPWDLFKTAIEPAGGIRSTIGDMVTYARNILAPAKSPLSASIQLSEQPLYYIAAEKMWIGMNWIIEPDAGLIWHNGETYGFNSIVAISTKKNQAVVAMADTTVMIKDAHGNSTFDSKLQNVAFGCLK